MGRVWGLAAALGALLLAPVATADAWLPHATDATWTYSWSDTQYLQTPIQEKVTVGSQKGTTFTLNWTTAGLGNPDGAITSTGDVQLQETSAGIINTDWSSSPPPPDFPVLCGAIAGCNNSLASTWYYLIWGSRSPVLPEPLLGGLGWADSGGAQGDVASTNSFVGLQRLTVPAFATPVTAAKIVSTITQAGALGDPYGSGTRTVWWVYGVGPVKMTFQHSGGAGAPLTTSVLQSTNQTPQPPPDLANYFPLVKGEKLNYVWTNTKHLAKPEVEEFTVDSTANSSARFTAKSVTGPLKVAATYGFSTRSDGITTLWGDSQATTAATFPPLGPAKAPAAKRRHFFTPFDLMTFGFNPLLPAYANVGTSWSSSPTTQDWTNFGVVGKTTIVGHQRVHVPAGTFEALVVRSTLRQPGFPFGSGTRTCWFAANKGLVKLVFHHGDGSVSDVELTRFTG